jgi:hypothetical protein
METLSKRVRAWRGEAGSKYPVARIVHVMPDEVYEGLICHQAIDMPPGEFALSLELTGVEIIILPELQARAVIEAMRSNYAPVMTKLLDLFFASEHKRANVILQEFRDYLNTYIPHPVLMPVP